MWLAPGSLLSSPKDGRPSFPRLYGLTLYQYLAEHPQLAASFHGFMSVQSDFQNSAVVDAYDFSGIQLLVDVGGGYGAALSAVLRRYPAMQRIVFDLPEVVAAAALQNPELVAWLNGERATWGDQKRGQSYPGSHSEGNLRAGFRARDIQRHDCGASFDSIAPLLVASCSLRQREY